MKKRIKKAGSIFLTLCVTFCCLSLSVYAGEGVLQFSDPTGQAGDVIEVRVKVISDSGPIRSYEIKAKYDPSLLRFESGAGCSAEDGAVTIASSLDGTQSEALQRLYFTALDEGQTKIEVTSYEAFLSSGEDLHLVLGNSTITIEGGTPVPATENPAPEGLSVQVNGETYTVNSDFMERDIPMGFVATETELNGVKTKAMALENGDQLMYYLKNGEGESSYFLYNKEDNSFTMTEPVMVNNSLTLFLMNHTPEFELPEKFWPTTLNINEKTFSIWNNMDNQDYYLIYAMNSNGDKGYYLYDSVESTYQRMNLADLKAEKKELENEEPKENKFFGFLKENLKTVLALVAVLFLLLLVVILILAAKLSRKADYEQYEAYDSDRLRKTSKKKKGARKNQLEDEEEDDNDMEDLADYEEEDDFEDWDDDEDEAGIPSGEKERELEGKSDIVQGDDDSPQKAKKGSDDFPIDVIKL